MISSATASGTNTVTIFITIPEAMKMAIESLWYRDKGGGFAEQFLEQCFDLNSFEALCFAKYIATGEVPIEPNLRPGITWDSYRNVQDNFDHYSYALSYLTEIKR